MDHHRHTCKLCFRRFPNGRALGGHMRSHVTSAAAAARHQQPPPPAAPPPPPPQPHASATHLLHQHSSSSSPSYSPSPGSHDELMANRTETSAYGGAGGRGSASAIAAASPGYVLRENPKKSYRMVDPEFSSTFAAPPPPTSVLDYGYYSTTTSSPVFGNGSTATANGNNNHSSSAVVQDGESETESSKAPAASSSRRRSKRRRRYELCVEAEEEDDDDQKLQHLRRNSSTGRKMKKIPVSEPDHPVSSVSDTTPDEDVALCLMMMSRDAGSWNKDEIGIGEQQGDRKDGEDDYEIPPNPPFEDDDDYFVDVAADHEEEEDDYDQGGMFRSGSAAGGKVRMPMQRKGGGRARFQCGTCKKVFRSYQALGGHRASHKKAKTCSAAATVAPLPIPPYSAPAAAAAEAPASVRRPTARIIVSADHEERHNYRRDHRYYHQQQRKYTINSNHNNRHQPQIQDEEEAEEDDPDWGEGEGDAPAPPDQRIHQCPFCSRVFSSGQALGGHKRSHLIGGAAYRIPYPAIRQNAAAPINNNRPEPAAKKATPAPPTYTGAASTSVSSYKKPAVRGGPSKHLPDNFIDLNLPAPVDEADEDGSYSAVSDADHF